MSEKNSTFLSWLEKILAFFRAFLSLSERESVTEPREERPAENQPTVPAHLEQMGSDSAPSNGKKRITKSPHEQRKTRITQQPNNKGKTRITEPPRIRFVVTVISGPGVIEGTGELSFGDTRIGAVPSDQAQNQIIIKGDPFVSGSHARISFSLEGITLRNDSRFGTEAWVKRAGRPLNYQPLSSKGERITLFVGSEIKMGDTVVRVTKLDRNSHPSQPDSASVRSWNPKSNRSEAYRFSVEEGPSLGQEFVIQNKQLPIILGRAANCAICLDKDLSVSGQHAELYQTGQTLRLRDLNSRSGTNLNGYDIEDKMIKPGDKIRLGNSLLVLKSERRGP